jgi:tyrosine-protein phosphatase SIW14
MAIPSLRRRLVVFLFAAAALCGSPRLAVRAQLANTATPAVSTGPEIAAAISSTPAERLKIAGIHNAAKISEVLFRGAQPSAQGLAELKKLGVTTVVDLRGNRGPMLGERAVAEQLGMSFVSIPVRGMSPPSHAQVAQFLQLFQDTHQKIFVHCYLGEDRTGVMVAAYRIAEQHWTADQAAREMNSFGFHRHLYRGMRAYIQTFPTNYAKNSAFASLHPAAAETATK